MPAFPYMSYKLTSLLFVIGLFLATLNLFLGALGMPPVVTTLLRFIGVFITGWSLLSYTVTKQLLSTQRLIATFFAAVIITGLFGVLVTFKFTV